MWPYHPALLETPVPRYTSFPTAAEFREGLAEADLIAALEQATGAISLYVHIPFCEKICWYCGCNTAAANRRQRLASYLDALHHEIALVAAHLPRSARVTRISFGGGSPNAIEPVDFLRLYEAMMIAFAPDDPVISVELDPRSLAAEWGPVLQSVGVSRASLGVQTFAPHCQEAIGRIQPLCMIERSTNLLRKAGVTSLNYDLMYGLPGQDRHDLENSLRLAAVLGADRLAVFGYAHVPHLIPRQKRIDDSNLPSVKERFAMAELAASQLMASGYEAVGFDHFARPEDPLAVAARDGTLHRNFQGFTDDPAPVLVGLGASAISSFPDLLIQNEKNAGRYRMQTSQGRLPVAHGIRRSADDQARGQVIRDLLCCGRARPAPAMLAAAWPRLAPFAEQKVCLLIDGDLLIAPGGLPYARGIAAAFDPYRQQSIRRFSSAI